MGRVKFTTQSLYLAICFLLFQNLSGSELSAIPGAWNTEVYLPALQHKRVGLIANHTSTIGKTHLADSLIKLKVDLQCIFAPEHGFRGEAANGEEVKNGIDSKTGIRVVSLYGNHLKPTAEDLKNIDILIFDIQDVGVRFYTYLSTLVYVMEAAAEHQIPLLVLDRPNPNGYYTDGPMLDTAYRSFVGVLPIPLVHGMTLGELAKMVNGEGWLSRKMQCSLTVVTCRNWNHNKPYVLPVPPSPNLPTRESIIAYPTMGLFEGINLSVGRGTDHPFECFGAPWLKSGTYVFVPHDIPGKTVHPPFAGDTCRGYLISDFARNYLSDLRLLYIEWLELLVMECPDKSKLFNNFFDKLAGTSSLRTQLLEGKTAAQIRKSWQTGLQQFETQRKPYLLYSWNPELGLIGD